MLWLKLNKENVGRMSLIKKVGLAAMVIFAILLGSWGVVLASADHFVTISPGKSTYIAEDQPKISAAWNSVPGVRLNKVKVYLDGKDITGQIKKNELGFTFISKTKLAQGKHLVEADLNYNVVVSRKVKTRWKFIIDTKPPAISITDNAAFVVSPAADYKIIGKSEPGTDISASFNSKLYSSLITDNEGNFSVDLKGLKDKNQLLLTATDKVGNVGTVLIPVIKDESTPTIEALMPAEGATLRSQSPKVAVKLVEADSGLKDIRLSIDDTLAVEKEGSESKEISYLGGLLSDGSHKAKIEAIDYAGHSLTKEWTFNVDSRRIVVNRGEHRLYFFSNGGLLKVYPVAVGMPAHPTPRGHFHTTYKKKNPTWIAPKSAWAANGPQSIPPGPGNPLGTRAIGLTVPAIFIHGTYSSYSIGHSASHGCIRMYIRDVEQLYEMVSPGIPVDIIN